MLYEILAAIAAALVVSLLAHTVLLWDLRRELRHLSISMAELEADLLSEKRKRAAVASLESRSRRGVFTADDDAAIERALIKPPVQVEDEAPWWAGFIKDAEKVR